MNKLVALIITLAPVHAWAHPGHGAVVAPHHVALVVAAVIAGLGAWGWSKARAERA